MKPDAPMDSLNGTAAEVAAFFRVSERTVYEWRANKEIGFWQHGRNITFGEENVIEMYIKQHSGVRGYRPGELEELTRKQWREHLRLVRTDMIMPTLSDALRRLAALELKLGAVDAAPQILEGSKAA